MGKQYVVIQLNTKTLEVKVMASVSYSDREQAEDMMAEYVEYRENMPEYKYSVHGVTAI